MVAKRACTADITILGVVANEDDDHHDAKDDDNDARGALITEERCVKAIVLEPHGHEAWGAAILLLDTSCSHYAVVPTKLAANNSSCSQTI